MSSFQRKSAAQRRYTILANTLNYRPHGVNLRSMNAEQIDAAYDRLVGMSATLPDAQSSNSSAARDRVLPTRPEMWKVLKRAGTTLQYSNSTGQQMYDAYKQLSGVSLPTRERRMRRVMTNPITGRELTRKGFKMFNELGYRFNGVWSVPRLGEIDITNRKIEADGSTMYPLLAREMKTYKTGLITYERITDSGSERLTEGFNVSDRKSATEKINEIIYRLLNDGALFRLISIKLFKPMVRGSEYFRIGTAYRGERNCVISALESHLKRDLTKLHETYEEGVSMDDYLPIAKQLGIVLRVDVCGQKQTYNEKRKKGIVDLKYLNNHVIANYNGDDREVKKYEKLSESVIDSIFKTDSVSEIESIIKIGPDVMCINTVKYRYQLSHQSFSRKDGSVELLKIESDALTATTEFKNLFISVNKIQSIYRNYEDARGFARHGVKILKSNYEKGSTIDMVSAYTNYMKWPCYEGIPFDITFWVNGDADMDVILKKYLGFGLVSGWKNYYTGDLETRWASIPHIKSRLSKGHTFTVHRWALAFAKGDLNLSMFENRPKRLWHLVLGSMCRTEFAESIATIDPILANSMGASKWKTINGVDVYTGSKESKLCKSYIHVSATVQSYAEIMMEDKYDQMNFGDLSWWAIYVDGISTNGDVSQYEDEHWQKKPNTTFSACDSGDMSYVEASIWDADIRKEFETENNNEWVISASMDENVNRGKMKYQKMYEDRWAQREFVDILAYGAGCHKFIDGAAGSGKSTMIKKIYNMCDAMILTPNNNQKATFGERNVQTIDMFLTQQKSLPFVIIDEYTHMKPEKLIQFERALLFGNVAQLKIGEYLRFEQYDHAVLSTVYRCNPELDAAACCAKKGDLTAFKRIDIVDALLKGHTILGATHAIIEKINDIGLTLDLPRIIRWTKTDLRRGIFAGDMGLLIDGMCVSNRTGFTHKMKVGRNPLKDPVVYGYARTYHATQGLEFNGVVCVINNVRDWDMIYTGATRVHNLDEVWMCKV